MNLDEIIEKQLELLSDFCVQVTDEDIEHMRNLPTEIAIENYARTLIIHRIDTWTEI